MRIDIVSVVPDILKSPFEASILKRAIDKGLVTVHFHNLRDYSKNKYKQVDDYQYGGGAGMVMTIEPIAALIEKLKAEGWNVVFNDSEFMHEADRGCVKYKSKSIIFCASYRVM